jgi:hypothetical protein
VLAIVRLGAERVPSRDELRRAAVIRQRHTQRGSFDQRALRGEFLDRLAVAAADEGGFLDVLEGERRAAASRLIAEALRDSDDHPGPDLRHALEAPALGVLSAAGDGLRDQLETGQALSALTLEAALEHCWIGFLDAPLQHAALRGRLADLLRRGEVPMLLLRIGHGAAAPQAARRPLDDLLEIA